MCDLCVSGVTEPLHLTDSPGSRYPIYSRKADYAGEVVNEMLSNQKDFAQEKTVVLTPENIKIEKILDESVVLSENDDK